MSCRICLSPSPGNHYKENCCRPCAAFFRRTVQLKLRYKCKRFGDCKLTKENRYFCKYCRMKRCIAVGMTDPEDSLSLDFYLDEIPEQELLLQPSPSEEDSLFADDIFHNPDKFRREMNERIHFLLQQEHEISKYLFSLNLCQQALKAYNNHERKWPKRNKGQVYYPNVFDFNEIMRNMHKQFLNAAEFCMEIDQFRVLPLNQKKLLFYRFYNRFIAMDLLFQTVEILGTDVNDTRTVYHDGMVADCRKIEMDVSKVNNSTEEALKSLLHGMEEDYVNLHLKQFKRVNPDRFELMYLLIFNMFNLKDDSLNISKETSKICFAVREQLSDELYMYYQYNKKIVNPALRIYKLHNLINTMDRSEEQYAEQRQMIDTFDLMKISVP